MVKAMEGLPYPEAVQANLTVLAVAAEADAMATKPSPAKFEAVERMDPPKLIGGGKELHRRNDRVEATREIG
ncbi:MAG TPA: hypothetical protein VHS33_10745 [Sphingomicrobium sp.]|jgi:hypothetical protein|nr:hypothetical protein [Sphingomicrobium sp.]